jgi:integrase
VIGHIPLDELHRRDVTRVIDAKIEDAPITARRVFEDVRALIRWAVSRGDLDHSPIDGLRGPAISKPRTRVLADSEIKAVWHDLYELRPDVGRVVRFCLVTGQRVGEVVGLTSNELDLSGKVWNIPAERSKNGHPHSVALTALALSIISECTEARPRFTLVADSNSDGIFDVSRNVVSDIIWRYGQNGGERWTTHDLRRTALTGMAKIGVAPIVIGHIANHRTTTKAGVTLGVYVHYDFGDEKRDALSRWSTRLQTIVSSTGRK